MPSFTPGVSLSHSGLLKFGLLLKARSLERIMASKVEGPTVLKVEGFLNFLCEKGSVLNQFVWSVVGADLLGNHPDPA